jgi:HEAT repeat protein
MPKGDTRPMIVEVLAKLSEGNTPSAVQVGHLSAVSASDLAELRLGLGELPAERREAILRLAVELGENDVQLDFTGLFRVALADATPAVRAAAIEGLWEDEDFRTAELLARMVQEDPDVQVRAAAALSLARFMLLSEHGHLYPPAGERVRATLLAVSKDEHETLEVRRRAIEALGVLSDDEVSRLIQSAYDNPDGKMRASAIYAMGRNGDDRWLPTILRELESGNPEFRFEAARAAGELESSRFVVPLINRLDDEDLEVRLAAIGALAEIGGDVAHKALEQCARSPELAMRQAARDGLDQLSLGTDPLTTMPFLDDSTRTI